MRVYAFFENPLFYETRMINRIPMALYSIGFYLKLLIIPYPLCCYYGYSTIPLVSWSTPYVIISLLFYLGILWYGLKKLKHKHILSYSIMVYLLGIFPFSNLISLSTGIIGERFIYFASLGFCLAVAYFLITIFKIDLKHQTKNLNTSFSFCVTFIFVLHGILTIARNANWKDEVTLFRHDSKNFKNSCNLQYITGNKIYSEVFRASSETERNTLLGEATGHYSQALKLMEEGVQKYPKDYTTMNNIGTLYINIFNNAGKAHPFFKKSISLKPDDEVTQFNDAFCYEKKNLPDSAIYYYENLVQSKTTYLPVYTQLRELYWKKSDYTKAIECDKKAIEINSFDPRLYINLGNSYMANKDTLNGILQFEEALTKEPDNLLLLNQITTFLTTSGYIERANELKKRFPH
jgi:tetratricopeptide (TPR) repeat protein